MGSPVCRNGRRLRYARKLWVVPLSQKIKLVFIYSVVGVVTGLAGLAISYVLSYPNAV